MLHLESLIEPLIQWIHANPTWAGFATGLISLAESLAVVGLLVPGSVIMTAIGALLGSGTLPMWSTMIWAIAGAIAGDSLSYSLGYHYRDRIRFSWPFSRFPQLLARGEGFFIRHGGKSVMLGRFVGPVRPIVPLVAGMMKMQPRRFLVANIASAIVWAPGYMIPGIILGAAAQEMGAGAVTSLILYLAIAVLILWLFGWLLKRLAVGLVKVVDKLLARVWHGLGRNRCGQCIQSILQDPSEPTHHRQFFLLMMGVSLLLLFSLIFVSVYHQGFITDANEITLNLLRSLRTQWLTTSALIITNLGQKMVILPVALSLITYFALRKQYWAAWHWLLAAVLPTLSVGVFKVLYSSPRPPGLVAVSGSSSFPSGHVTLALALYGFAAFFYGRQLRVQGRRWLNALAGLIIALVLFSRLYLNAHWASDVSASLCLGGGLLCLVMLSYRRRPVQVVGIRGSLFVGLLVLLAIFGDYTYSHFKSASVDVALAVPQRVLSQQRWWDNAVLSQPVTRNNRFGHPAQLITIQWQGSLPVIEARLLAKGWQTKPGLDLARIIHRFAAEPDAYQMPLLAQLYRDQKPALVMIKSISRQGPPIVLHLWDSEIQLAPGLNPLWFGTVNFQLSRQEMPIIHRKPYAFQSADAELVADLGHRFRWRRLKYNSDSFIVKIANP